MSVPRKAKKRPRAKSRPPRPKRDSSDSPTAPDDFDEKKRVEIVRQMTKSLGRRRRFSPFADQQSECAAILLVVAGFYSWAAIDMLYSETRKFPSGGH